MHNKHILIVLGVVAAMAAVTVVVSAGNPDNPPGSPEMTYSHTLEDVYNRLDTGTEATQSTFTEPSGGPETGTMHTLNEIYDLIGERAPVPKTGQTNSYTVGDDGDLKKGVAWPNPRFITSTTGIVTDTLTGLIWLENANCTNGVTTFSDALTFTNSLYDGWTGDGSGGDCGLSDESNAGDWRLPNVRELQSLIHYGTFNPAVSNTAGTGSWSEGDPFTGIQSSNYWSSTLSFNLAAPVWIVDLFQGYVSNGSMTQTFYVWPVRGGQ